MNLIRFISLVFIAHSVISCGRKDVTVQKYKPNEVDRSPFADQVAITNAINLNDVKAVKDWIENGGNPNSYGSADHITPTHMAAAMHRTEVLSLFLANGADPNATDLGGNTTLHHAAANGRAFSTEDTKMQSLILLIGNGADPEIISKEGLTPAQIALLNNNDILSAQYLNGKAEQTPPPN